MSDPYRATFAPKVIWEGNIEGQSAVLRVVVRSGGEVEPEISHGVDAMGIARWDKVDSGWSQHALKTMARALATRS